MTSVLQAVQFPVPLLNPSNTGLYGATTWQTDGVPRWLDPGVQFRPVNTGATEGSGVWSAPAFATSDELTDDDIKKGVRPALPDTFTALTVWSEDDYDLFETTDGDIVTRAQQNLRLGEQQLVEAAFATRVLADAGTPDTSTDIVGAIAYLEGLFAKAGVTGQIHASAEWAASAAQAMLLTKSGSVSRTPLGHQWVFGGGYVDGLGDTLVATFPTFGWRTDPVLRVADSPDYSRHTAIAERSVVVGYEALVGAVTITG